MNGSDFTTWESYYVLSLSKNTGSGVDAKMFMDSIVKRIDVKDEYLWTMHLCCLLPFQ